MTDLIVALENLTKPNRTIDAAIWKLADKAAYDLCASNAVAFAPKDISESQKTARVYDRTRRLSPKYTNSLDAAMTLAPEGWTLQLSDWDHPALRADGPWQAIFVRMGKRGTMNAAFEARCDHAPTPAIAICIAALKARAAKDT